MDRTAGGQGNTMEDLNNPVRKNFLASNVPFYSEAEIDKILNSIVGDVSFLSIPSVLDTQKKFEQLVRRCIYLELHSITLREYYRHQRIPRGMRSRLRPHLFTRDADFRARFEQLSNHYAFDLILLNLDFLQKQLTDVKRKVQEQESVLQSLLSKEHFDKFMEEHKASVAKYRAELEDVKRQKWQRDIRDYETGFVYSWSSSTNSGVNNQSRSLEPQPWKKPTRRGGRKRNRTRKNLYKEGWQISENEDTTE